MPATDDVHEESCAKIDDHAPDGRTDEAILILSRACAESPALAALGVAPSEPRAAEDRLKWHFLLTPDGTWSWQGIRVEAESDKRFATLVAAMENADRPGRAPGVSEFGCFERLDEDCQDRLHRE